MREEEITSENCARISREYPDSGDIYDKAKAWSLVYNFCLQKGMKGGGCMTGIETVIKFLEGLFSPAPEKPAEGRSRIDRCVTLLSKFGIELAEPSVLIDGIASIMAEPNASQSIAVGEKKREAIGYEISRYIAEGKTSNAAFKNMLDKIIKLLSE